MDLFFQDEVRDEAAFEKPSEAEKLSSPPYLAWLKGNYLREISTLHRKLDKASVDGSRRESRLERLSVLKSRCLPFVQARLEWLQQEEERRKFFEHNRL